MPYCTNYSEYTIMIEIIDKKQCCGCTACASICPKNAISMIPDTLGFLYPVVNKNKCIGCGICEKVCQFNSAYKRYSNYDIPLVYGCRHKDIKELETSQSGGLSEAIIEAFLKTDGVVYGVGYDGVTHVLHKRATTLDECNEFKGSKYVQSDLRGIFKMVAQDLSNGERVLFIGTGCQVAGLKASISPKLIKKLLTVDLVCHATPSPAVWKSYVQYLERKYKKRIISVNFRDKGYGWHSHNETFVFEGGGKIMKIAFRNLFYRHKIIRYSCSNCPFTNLKRVSDLTISDFWGWEKYYDLWNDNKGVSLLLINSEVGNSFFFNSLKQIIYYQESDITKCLQPQLKGPVTIDENEIREIERIFLLKGFYGIALKYHEIGICHQIIRLSRFFKKRLHHIRTKWGKLAW